MKFITRIFVLLAVFAATLASAQTLPTFKHIVIIVQENRTPDNLFGAGALSGSCNRVEFEPGVDIADGGPAAGRGFFCNQPVHLQTGYDLDHTYKTGWLGMWDNGSMDGACGGTVYNPDNLTVPTCPEYSYVNQFEVQPYFDIATNYGFANYMFQSNEGPSFPAHQFLLGGTSAPVAPVIPTFLDFVAENRQSSNQSGCPDTLEYDEPPLVDPKGTLHDTVNDDPPVECYDHQTLVDLLDNHQPNKISWRWYTPTPGSIWTAVNAIKHLCWNQPYPLPGTPCNNTTDWVPTVFWPAKSKTAIPFLTDIDNCQLQQVSWVIPDEKWSDHPGKDGGPGGPSYVADLVNEIGNATNCDNGGYWSDTAIFITWDDWGGFYDHVKPPAVYRSPDGGSCPTSIAPNGWGCGYTYGFRVPLLVVSAYTPARYVSGALPSPGRLPKYEHDFGSILAFIENNFSLGPIAPPFYADVNARDHAQGNIPLSDFFSIPASSPRTFVPILPATGFDKSYFQNYYTTPQNGVLPQPEGPDGDDAD
jgi:phospholipase C